MRHLKYHRQQGAALIVALIFLIIITLLGVSSMDDTVLETQLAKNNREVNYALQIAEAGLMGSAPLLEADFSEPGKLDELSALMRDGVLYFDADSTDDYEEAAITRNDISTSATTVEATSEETEIYYKGEFSLGADTPCGKGYSALKFRAHFFETLTEGQSAPNQRHTKLRRGFCITTPKAN